MRRPEPTVTHVTAPKLRTCKLKLPPPCAATALLGPAAAPPGSLRGFLRETTRRSGCDQRPVLHKFLNLPRSGLSADAEASSAVGAGAVEELAVGVGDAIKKGAPWAAGHQSGMALGAAKPSRPIRLSLSSIDTAVPQTVP
jgi:hypothetical protein